MKKFFDERTICFSASSDADYDKKIFNASSNAQQVSMFRSTLNASADRSTQQASVDKKICKHVLIQDVKLVLKE